MRFTKIHCCIFSKRVSKNDAKNGGKRFGKNPAKVSANTAANVAACADLFAAANDAAKLFIGYIWYILHCLLLVLVYNFCIDLCGQYITMPEQL